MGTHWKNLEHKKTEKIKTLKVLVSRVDNSNYTELITEAHETG